jgi:hypothetical protein
MIQVADLVAGDPRATLAVIMAGTVFVIVLSVTIVGALGVYLWKLIRRRQ